MAEFQFFENNQAVKPPIGLKARHVHNQERISEIVNAMKRYDDYGMKIPLSWIEELKELHS